LFVSSDSLEKKRSLSGTALETATEEITWREPHLRKQSRGGGKAKAGLGAPLKDSSPKGKNIQVEGDPKSYLGGVFWGGGKRMKKKGKTKSGKVGGSFERLGGEGTSRSGLAR